MPHPFDLDALVHPLTPARFLEDHWPTRSFVGRGGLERLDAVSRIPQLAGIEALLEVFRSQVVLFEPDGSRSSVPAEEAMVRYRGGATLYLVRLERWVPALRPLMQRLATTFGIDPGSIEVEAFASRPGARSSMHFDYDLNFNLLLHGSKEWWLAENQHIVNPVASHTVGLVNEQAAYARRVPFPTELPKDARHVECSAGDVVFLPRGVWHETRARTESFGVAFVLKPPVWYRLFNTALSDRLRRSEEWREFAFGLSGIGPGAGQAQGRFERLREAMISELRALKPEDLSWSQERARFSWRPSPRPALTEEDGEWVLCADSSDPSSVRAALDEEFVPFVRALVELADGTFSFCDAAARRGSLSYLTVREVLAWLCGANILAAVD